MLREPFVIYIPRYVICTLHSCFFFHNGVGSKELYVPFVTQYSVFYNDGFAIPFEFGRTNKGNENKNSWATMIVTAICWYESAEEDRIYRGRWRKEVIMACTCLYCSPSKRC